MLKKVTKYIFSLLGATRLLDMLLFRISAAKFFYRNRRFKKNNSEFSFPPDYFLYETYQLDYKQYKEDGEITAREIIEWAKPYINNPACILEWGCGVGRIVRHIANIAPSAEVFGVDINFKMIEWNIANIPNVNFKAIDYTPPIASNKNRFDLVYAISVFTHIEADKQIEWIKEMHRITAEDGIFMFTTHGKKYVAKLYPTEKDILKSKGVFTRLYKQNGHRMMSTFNISSYFEDKLKPFFKVLEFYDGEIFPKKVGGQDFWVVKKVNK